MAIIGTNPSGTPPTGYSGQTNIANQAWLYGPLVAGQSGSLASISLYSLLTNTATLFFAIYNDSAGAPTTVVSNSLINVAGNGALITAAYSSKPSLTSGSSYWLAFESPTNRISGGLFRVGSGSFSLKTYATSGNTFTNSPSLTTAFSSNFAAFFATFATTGGIPPMLLFGNTMMFAGQRRKAIWWPLSFITRPLANRLLLPRKVLAV